MPNKQNIAGRAADLIRNAAESAKMALNIEYIQKDILEIKQSIKDISINDKDYVLKEEFLFWRNLLVSGILLTIFLGIVVNLTK